MGWFTGSAPTSTSTSSPSYARSRARNAARSPVSVLVKPALRVVALCWHHVSSVVVLSRVVIRDWLSGVAHHVQPGGGDDLAQNLDDAPTERVDLRRPPGALHLAAQHGTGGAVGEVADRAEDPEEEAIRLDLGLDAEHLL